MKYIEKNHGHWQLRGNLRDLLLECQAEEAIRYATDGIYVGKNTIVSTDGRRLIELKIKHNIPEGNYFCTADGFLLDFMDGNFPKYKDIIPDKSKSKKIVETSADVGGHIVGLILGELCHARCITMLSFYQRPIEILSQILCGKCEVYVHETEPREQPFMIEAETAVGDLRYIQMPIAVKNKV